GGVSLFLLHDRRRTLARRVGGGRRRPAGGRAAARSRDHRGTGAGGGAVVPARHALARRGDRRRRPLVRREGPQLRSAAIARSSQPTMKDTPPTGVIAPRPRTPVSTSA